MSKGKSEKIKSHDVENRGAERDNNEVKVEKSGDIIDDSADTQEDKSDEMRDEAIKEEDIMVLEEKFNDLTDRYLRLQAEFDNFRKRTIREKADLIRSGSEEVLSGILPVIDDFERAIESLADISDGDPAKQGTLLIYNKFKDFLKQNNVKEIDALHKEFDVDHQEAAAKIEADEKFKGKVVDVIQKGYMLNDKVIRYAKVVVGE